MPAFAGMTVGGSSMRIRSPKDFWAGLIFIAIAGGFVLLAQQYRLGDLHRMVPERPPRPQNRDGVAPRDQGSIEPSRASSCISSTVRS